MLASEFVEKLQNLIAKHGDSKVFVVGPLHVGDDVGFVKTVDSWAIMGFETYNPGSKEHFIKNMEG